MYVYHFGNTNNPFFLEMSVYLFFALFFRNIDMNPKKKQDITNNITLSTGRQSKYTDTVK